MADNIFYTNPSSGTAIATDEISGAHYQLFKLVDGTTDSTTPIPGDGTNGLDVDVTRVQGVVNVSGSIVVSNTLFTSGTSTVTGTVSVGNTVITSGTATVVGSVSISNTPTISGSVTVDSLPSVTIGNTVTVQGTSTVSGTVNIGNVVNVSGTVAVSTPMSFVASGTITTYNTYDPGTIDSFGHLIIGTQINQIEVPFFRAIPSSLVTVTTSGGTALASGTTGGAKFETGTAVTGFVKGVSLTNIRYQVASEIYAYFTAAFTVPTDSLSKQRVGLYDNFDGFFLGYEGSGFSVTIRNNSVDTTTYRANFNGDTLSGSVNSLYTRSGVPEVLNPTFLNVYRIRLGWLGAAPIEFEVLSPDGHWIGFHQIRQPNTVAIPSVENPDLPMTIEAIKTGSNATNIRIFTGCWAAGTTSKSTVGNTAHDDPDLGNPVKIGGVARTTNPTSVASGDRVNAYYNTQGKAIMLPQGPRELVTRQHTQIANSSAEAVILSGSIGTYHDLTHLIFTNQAASAINVTVKEASGGATAMIVSLAANGGANLSFPVPVTQTTQNTSWTATLSVANATVNIFTQAIKN